MLFFIFLLLLVARAPGSTATAQSPTDEAVESLLAQLGPEARVGQLFMVTFAGSEAPPGSAISQLITDYQIGGVVLRAANDNIDDRQSATAQIAALTNTLQEQALLGAPAVVTDTVDATPTPVPPPVGLPLFIGVEQAGDGFPSSQILSGLTPLPSQMAIGATWDPANAEVTGVIAGQQLSALGINMLLGPSLDVLAEPNPYVESSVGTATFGGNPYWVGQMGQAYIGGIHSGSQGRMAVVANHFPGQGSSDRLVDEEIATVRKTLNDLRTTDLRPFFAVTSGPDPREQVDALQTSQVRYQGLQGPAGSTTAPFSFDPQAIGAVLGLPEIAPWRRSGGILFSGPLGTPAIEQYYAEGNDPFPHRLVAKDAFLAGHDLLFLTDFAATEAGTAAQIANIEDTILWFRERYETDIAFRQQVDASVRRILRLKLRLYGGDFTPENVQVPAPQLEELVQAGNTLVFELARQALTAVAPAPGALPNQLQTPPQAGENIVIFTDENTAFQCSLCEEQAQLGVDDLEQRLLTLYGPSASNQLTPDQINSYPLEELSLFLETAPVPQPPPTPDPEITVEPPAPEEPTPLPTPTTSPAFFVQESLREADWIIFAVRDVDPVNSPLREFLRTQDQLLRQARVVVMAFGPPYYLDTTETSKLTAYFATYSTGAPFADAAARALFLESPLSGDSPVDIPGIGYSLEEVTLPDPNQVIGLYIEQDEEEPAGAPGPLEVLVGQTLRLTTGVVLDYNGHPVPDGTIVSFIQQDRVQGFSDVIAQRPTQDGVATLDYLLEARTGNFRLTVQAGEADASLVIDLVIEDETVGVLAVSSPTPRPTPTPTPTGTPTPTPTITLTPTPTPTPTPVSEVPAEPGLRITPLQLQRLSGLLLGVLLVGGIGGALAGNHRLRNRRLQLRFFLAGMCGGLLLYLYVIVGLPGASLFGSLGGWDAFLLLSIGGLLAMAAAWIRA